jgi:hypothetical protein
MLTDLSCIALEWAKSYVRQRQTFKLNTKGENVAPLAFQHDPDGTYHELTVHLRNVDPAPFNLSREGPLIEPMEGETEEGKGETPESRSTTRTPAAPLRTGARSASRA